MVLVTAARLTVLDLRAGVAIVDPRARAIQVLDTVMWSPEVKAMEAKAMVVETLAVEPQAVETLAA